MKDWIKKKVELTPKRRLDVGYWIGTFQAILMMTIFQDLASDEPVGVAYWIGFFVAWAAIGFIYIRNVMAFEKETLWMTIKNPAKVTREEGHDMFGMPMVRPTRPPPPPAPPAPRKICP